MSFFAGVGGVVGRERMLDSSSDSVLARDSCVAAGMPLNCENCKDEDSDRRNSEQAWLSAESHSVRNPPAPRMDPAFPLDFNKKEPSLQLYQWTPRDGQQSQMYLKGHLEALVYQFFEISPG